MRRVSVIAFGLVVWVSVLWLPTTAVSLRAQTPPAKGKVDAAELYKTKCAVCHAPDGNSPLPNMSFADGIWLHGSTIAAVTNTITNGAKSPTGAPTAMMPFKEQLAKDEIAALARYVRRFDKKLK